MGNHASCVTVGNTRETIHLVHSDNNVEILHKLLYDGQIMEGFPRHLVCHSHSFYISQRTLIVSPDSQLSSKTGRGSANVQRRLCSTPELQKDYAQLVKSKGHCWRPTLESIRENEKKVEPNIFKKIKRSWQIRSSSSL